MGKAQRRRKKILGVGCRGGGGGGGGRGWWWRIKAKESLLVLFLQKLRSGILDSGIPYDCFILIVIVKSPLLTPPPFFSWAFLFVPSRLFERQE